MNLLFRETPQLFGTFHLVAVLVIIIIFVLAFQLIRKLDEAVLIRLLHLLGLVMIVMEIWKQWFSYAYVYGFSMWFFPWQLCSMAMYCSFLVSYLKEKLQNATLTFLATYSLVAAIMALAVPADMLRPQILLTLHGFIYHGLMLIESAAAIIILNKRKQYGFRLATIMFLIMASIAEIINIVSHLLLNNYRIEPNMFNITPYYPSNQPVFSWIATNIGIIPEIIIYLLLIILTSWCLLQLLRKRR